MFMGGYVCRMGIPARRDCCLPWEMVEDSGKNAQATGASLTGDFPDIFDEAAEDVFEFAVEDFVE